MFAAIALGIGLGPLPSASAANPTLALQVTITDVNGNPISVIDQSQRDKYRVAVSYSCNGDTDCTGVVLKVSPNELDAFYATYRRSTDDPAFTPPSPGVTMTGGVNAGYTINVGTVTAGTNGVAFLTYDLLPGVYGGAIGGGSFFLDGTSVTSVVKATATNATSVSSTASATWRSYVGTPDLSVSVPATKGVDTPVTVTVNSGSDCWRTVNGGLVGTFYKLCDKSWTVTVDLPPNAVHVAGSGGSYNATTHAVTIAVSGVNAAGGARGRTFQVTFPAARYVGNASCVADETFSAHDAVHTYLDGTVKSSSPATASAKVTIGNCPPFAKASVAKSSGRDGSSGAVGTYTIPAAAGAVVNTGYWQLQVANQGNVSGVGTLTDTFNQADLPVYQLQVVGGGPATVQYTLDDGTTGTVTVTTASPYNAPAGRRIASMTATSSPLAGPNIQPSETDTTWFTVRAYFKLANGATPGNRANTVTGEMHYPAYPSIDTLAPEKASRQVALVNAVTNFTLSADSPAATVAGGGSAVVGSTVTWKAGASVANLPTGTTLTPQYIFMSPVGWDIQAGSASLAAAVPGATFDYRTVSFGGVDRQAVVVTWPAPVTQTGGFTLPTLTVRTTPTTAAAAGSSTARMFFGDVDNVVANIYNNSKAIDTDDLDADGLTTDAFAANSGSATLASSLKLAVKKEICKPNLLSFDGCDWLSDPSQTVPVPPNASSIKYRVTLQNTGNATLSNLFAYDVLPFVGDSGTTTATASTPRGSTVRETLASTSNVSPGVTLSYSTSTNPPRANVYSGTTTGDWLAPLAGASAIRAQVASLAAGASVYFTYDASLTGGSADQTACNSVAAVANSLVAVEPPAVCASTEEADFQVKALAHFPLQRGRVGQVPFDIVQRGGSAVATGVVTLAVPGGLDVADLAVAGWSCTAASMTGPTTVTCAPVKADGSPRPLAKDVHETLALKVRPRAAASDQLCVTGTAVSDMTDPNASDNQATSCATVVNGDLLLVLDKDDLQSQASVGQQYTYTLDVANRMVGETAAGVVVTDTLPAGLQYVSSSPAATVAGQKLTFNVGSLAPAGVKSDGSIVSGGAGSSQRLSVTVKVRPGTKDSIANTATATATNPADSSTLRADDTDTDGVLNAFADQGAMELTPQNTPVTTPLNRIASAAGAPLDPSTVVQETAPAHGSLTISASTGAVTFVPARGYSGNDSYQVRVCDTSATPQCFVARVQLTVGTNTVTAVDDSGSTRAGESVTTAVTSNDTSASGQDLLAPVVSTDPVHGTTEVGPDASITYAPAPGFSGSDRYTYRLCDTSLPTAVCDNAVVAVTVANVFHDSGISPAAPQNTAITTPLEDIVSTTGEPIDRTSVTRETAPAHGTITIDPSTGAVTYRPATGYIGPDAYAIRVCDANDECHRSTVGVDVQTNVVTAVADDASTDAGVPARTDVRGNDTSASGQSFADPTVTTAPGHGSTTVEADGTISYAPAAQFSGTDTYTYRVCDTSTPTAVCDSTSVTVRVTNHFTDLGAQAVTPHNEAVATPLDEIVTTTGSPVDPASVSTRTAPAHGAVVYAADGTATYTPAHGYAGEDSYEVDLCDTSTPTPQCSAAEVRVVVRANTVLATADDASTEAGAPVTTAVTTNDSSASGQELSRPTISEEPDSGIASVNADSSITFVPDTGFSGVDRYTYRLCDTSDPTPVCDEAVVTVEVANVFSHGPAAADRAGIEAPQNAAVTTRLDEIVSAQGAPFGPASVAQAAAPEHGTITIDPSTGAVTYLPAPGYAGPDGYAIEVCDTAQPTAECVQVPVAVTVLPNAVVAPDLPVSTRADTATDPIDLLGATTSSSGQALDLPAITADPEHGSLTDHGDGTVTYTPDAGYDGDDVFTYQVCDTSDPTPVCDAGTVTVTVTPVADLGLVKTLGSPEVVAGSPISYDIALTNRGPSLAADVHSYDPIPREIVDPVGTPDPDISGSSCETRPTLQSDLDRLEPAYGPYSFTSHPLVVECTYPVLPPGTTVLDTISGTVDPVVVAGKELVNQAVAFSTTYDPVFGDNLSAAPAEVSTQADLAITKVVDEPEVRLGDEATFTVTVRNQGPSLAPGVVVVDVPTGMEVISSDPSRGSFAGGRWSLGTLAVGEAATLTARYRVNGVQANNTATARSSVSDTVATDNEARVVLAVSPPGGGKRHDWLPGTGNPVNPALLRLAFALLVTGGFLVGFGRRRRDDA